MDKLLKLKEIMQDAGSALVAFSGGVDSTLLLAAALQALGSAQVLAVTAVSELVTTEEIDEARETAKQLGARHLVMHTGILDKPEFTANTPERCYHCKKHLLGLLLDIASKHNLARVVEGSNLDDLSDYRPGYQAVREMGILSPLQEAKLGKNEIRMLAQRLELPVWNKPSRPCLATRLPYGTPITREALERVRKAEEFLFTVLGERQIRVRDHGSLARLEVSPQYFPQVIEPSTAAVISQELKRLGYAYTALDLAGYRQGSLNEKLQP
ncbi:MAG: ATP-dependent sacrificial sulfur transferase LarE [Peptococcaceae bacterium]|jgi:uncharacterized protein|nr:ATP-dependent sacrificial sulfur transferase LarE [Peptococcaceae bacterium]MDH7524890.1 ATP-dependent sacrificial sulfur transferase LarE [Peptococcaceae bacterium]